MKSVQASESRKAESEVVKWQQASNEQESLSNSPADSFNQPDKLSQKADSLGAPEESITVYKEQLISQIDDLFQKKLQYDISQLRSKINTLNTGIVSKRKILKRELIHFKQSTDVIKRTLPRANPG